MLLLQPDPQEEEENEKITFSIISHIATKSYSINIFIGINFYSAPYNDANEIGKHPMPSLYMYIQGTTVPCNMR